VPAGTDRNVFDRLRPVRRALGPVEAAQVRRFGGSMLSLAFRTTVLLLHTTGRTSGVERTTTLAHHEDADGSLLIVGGAGGQARIPDWVANLRAAPRAAVTLDRLRVEVTARELAGDERTTVWQRLTAVWPQIEAYERRAGRPVPVFRLTRTTHDGA
jgi:deazaflavin-dependent oxidoreductase (nitroreductase family)